MKNLVGGAPSREQVEEALRAVGDRCPEEDGCCDEWEECWEKQSRDHDAKVDAVLALFEVAK